MNWKIWLHVTLRCSTAELWILTFDWMLICHILPTKNIISAQAQRPNGINSLWQQQNSVTYHAVKTEWMAHRTQHRVWVTDPVSKLPQFWCYKASTASAGSTEDPRHDPQDILGKLWQWILCLWMKSCAGSMIILKSRWPRKEDYWTSEWG